MPKGTRRPFTARDMEAGKRGRGHATKNSDKTQAYRTKKDKEDKEALKKQGAKGHNKKNPPGSQRKESPSGFGARGRTTGSGEYSGIYKTKTAGTKKSGPKATEAKTSRARNIRNAKNAPTKRKVRTGVSNGKRGSTKRR